jgi:hypothetical protein
VRAAEDGACSDIESAGESVACAVDSRELSLGFLAKVAGSYDGGLVLVADIVEEEIVVEGAQDLAGSFDLLLVVAIMCWVVG